MVKDVIGWAVVEGDKIKVRTVSDSRRAAMVNWLVTERRIFITNAMTDDEIARSFYEQQGDGDILIEYVTISIGPPK